MKNVKGYFRFSVVFASLLVFIFASTSPAFAAQNNKAKQVKLNVTGSYVIVSMSVYGNNQWGNWTYWPAKSPNSNFPIPWKCINYPAAIPDCPYSKLAANYSLQGTTQTVINYWWQGTVTVDFEVVAHFYGTEPGPRHRYCTVIINENSWFDTITITYDAKTDRCSS